jgi:hypothetical protein
MPRFDAGPSAPIPVLIRVPELRVDRDRPQGYGRASEILPRPGFRRPLKRRLRRVVKLTASALVVVLGLGLAWQVLVPLGPARLPAPILSWGWSRWAHAEPARSVTAPTPPPLPTVRLSIEPVGVTADAEAEAPVVFPGYLLPEDNHEESAHEGS